MFHIAYVLFFLLMFGGVGVAGELPMQRIPSITFPVDVRLPSAVSRNTVEIGTLSAARFNDLVHIAWDTRQEGGNHGFEIERRAQDGTSWTTVGYVPSTKAPSSMHEYHFVDRRSFDQVTYYRIKQISSSSTVNYSGTMTVHPDRYSKGFEIVQTLSKKSDAGRLLSITLAEERSVSVRVLDRFGRSTATVLRDVTLSAGHHLIPFAAHDLPAGVYMLKLESVDGVMTTMLSK